MMKSSEHSVRPVRLVFKSGVSIRTAKTFPGSLPKRITTRKKLDADKLKAEKIEASICANVELPFRNIKQVFGYGNVRYRDLAKVLNLLASKEYMLA